MRLLTNSPRIVGIALGAAAALGCNDSSAPAPQTIPDFVYVANAAGNVQLVSFKSGAATPLTTGSDNYDPDSRASRLVFASERNGLPEIFISDLDAGTPHRVTNLSEFSRSPSLSPNADSIAFVVSSFTGAPRIFVIAAPSLNAPTFDSAAAIATGSATSAAEGAPAWSPAGGVIAFTSTRSAVSQVYVVPSGGGSATAVTSEAGGAFEPSWSADGTTIYYLASTPLIVLRRVSARGGGATTVVDDPQGVAGPASCNASLCLFNTDPTGTAGSMCALVISAGRSQLVFPRTAAQERQPAILVQ